MNLKIVIRMHLNVILVLLLLVACNSPEIKSCFPEDKLPDYITPLTDVGQRSEWSHDNRTVYYVDRAGGEVWKVDIESGETTQITNQDSRPEGHGYYRVYELSNGDLFFACGATRRSMYMQIWPKGSERPISLDEAIAEGPAISRTDMKIVWTPEQEVIYAGRIEYQNGIPAIVDKRLIIDNDSVVVDGIKYEGILEPQNFIRPEEKEFTWTQYGNTEAGLFTSEVMIYNFETGEIKNYSMSPNQYSEPEGIFPDGKYTLIESDAHSLKGIKHIDVYKMALDGTGQNMERVTFFNDLPDYKGSNPVVSDDGKKIAFQAAYAKADAGVGCGIYLLDLEKWEAKKSE